MLVSKRPPGMLTFVVREQPVVFLSSPLRGVSLNDEGSLCLHLGVGGSGMDKPKEAAVPSNALLCCLKVFLYLLLSSIPAGSG